MAHQNLIVEQEGVVATLWFNRPEVHNAFNDEFLIEMSEKLTKLAQDDSIRILVLRGKGKSFCAGADLNWMKAAVNFPYSQNLDDGLILSNALYALHNFPKPTMSIVHGAVYGGGLGLAASCDFVFGLEDTALSLSEVKLGLIPACISPYVLQRMGEAKGRQAMLRGQRMSAETAESLGLIDFFGNEKELMSEWDLLKKDLLTSGPQASMEIKRLVRDVMDHWTLKEAKRKTAERIAEIRTSKEAQEGMNAFFEKRKPNWDRE